MTPLSLGGENVFGEGCCCFGAGVSFSGPGTRKNDVSELAEREGFEPPIPVKVCPLSRRIVSTTHAPLRAKLTIPAKRGSALDIRRNRRWIEQSTALTSNCSKRTRLAGRAKAVRHDLDIERSDLQPQLHNRRGGKGKYHRTAINVQRLNPGTDRPPFFKRVVRMNV